MTQTAPANDLFEFLDEAHREIQRKLITLTALIDGVEQGSDAAALRTQARDVHDWFAAHSRQHHLDEETHIFPALLASGDPKVVEQTRRLMQDHGWIEEDWIHLAPLLQTLADGGWVDPQALRETGEIFGQLVLDHLLLEEAMAYPTARQGMTQEKLLAAGTEMARRRAVREARNSRF